MRKLILGFDLDDTLNDLVSKLLIQYNQKYNDNLSIDDITDYKIHKFLKPECKNVFKEFANDDLFLSLQPEPHSIEVLSRLNEEHLVYFITAGHPKTIAARDKWLSTHLSFYSSMQLICCRFKQLLTLDLLVDDCLDNHTGSSYNSLVYDKPWNRSGNVNRVFNWLDVEREIGKLDVRING